ncbi:MAG: phosphotyrosine protein phosphatase [Candidatus Cloacimonadota bacterium]|nr:MAG: phosphotyrosine protein phosphatase [Candidatus Cloacimonadota bacterium]PCJ21015.1 MAG: phosphotyrosine protein phosphatase [Candidatus Cloacimonadota bacterium]
MKNLLFICSENKLRSLTAETYFSNFKAISVIGAGTNKDANTTISGDLIEWADIVFVMEKSHRNKVNKKFKELFKLKRMIVLDIPDNYDYMDRDLINLLDRSVSKHIILKK